MVASNILQQLKCFIIQNTNNKPSNHDSWIKENNTYKYPASRSLPTYLPTDNKDFITQISDTDIPREQADQDTQIISSPQLLQL